MKAAAEEKIIQLNVLLKQNNNRQDVCTRSCDFYPCCCLDLCLLIWFTGKTLKQKPEQ